MNEKLKHLIEQVGTDSSGKWMRIDQAEKLVRLVLEESLSAIDNTDKRHAYTTYDLGNIEATIHKSKEAVRNHFGV